MHDLCPPDCYHLSASVGWVELGNPGEAKAELAKIDPCLQRHPDVLEVKWMILAEEKDWDAAADIALTLTQNEPQRASGWLHYSYALRRARRGGLRAAWEALLPAIDGFPDDPTIPYNLSCYASQLGLLPEAKQWFQEALRRGDRKILKRMALQDEDLKPLWNAIGSM